MAEASQYVLSFDFNAFITQIADLTNAYNQLENKLGDISRSSEATVKEIELKFSSISKSIDTSLVKLDTFFSSFHNNLGQTGTLLQTINAESKNLSETFKSMANLNVNSSGGIDASNNLSQAASLPKGFTFIVSGEDDQQLSADLAKVTLASKAAQQAIKDADKADKVWKKTAKAIGDNIVKEVRTAKDKVKSIMSSFTGGVLAGGLATAAIGMMISGVHEGQRRGAERGEMANAFEGFGNLFEDQTKKAVRSWSRLQEQAQYKWGVGRKEIQGVVASLKNSGFSDVVDKNLGRPAKMVEENAAAASINLDKYLNIATGTSAKQAIELSDNLGYSFETSIDKLKKLNLEAKSSGAGFEKFTGAVLAGSAAMSQYRVDVSEVAEVMRKVQGYYEGLGMSKQQSGSMAAQITKGLAEGGGNEAIDMKFFQQYYAEKGINLNAIEAVQRGREEFTKAGQEEGTSEILTKRLKFEKDWAVRVSGGNRTLAIRYLREAFGRTGKGQAEFIIDKASSLQGDKALSEGDKASLDELKKAMTTEGSKLTQLQKNQRDLINGMAKMGQGIMEIVSNLLATIVLGIRTLPASLANAWVMFNPLSSAKDVQKAEESSQQIQKLMFNTFSQMGHGVDTIMAGWDQTKKATGDTLDIIGMGSLKTAATVDIPGTTWTRIAQRIDEAVTTGIGDVTEGISRDLEAMSYRLDGLLEYVSSDKSYKQIERETDERVADLEDRSSARIQAAHNTNTGSKPQANQTNHAKPVTTTISGKTLDVSIKKATMGTVANTQ
jgi:hypothetical protein